MALTPGTRLGVYDIAALLGEGGTPGVPGHRHEPEAPGRDQGAAGGAAARWSTTTPELLLRWRGTILAATYAVVGDYLRTIAPGNE